VDNGDKPIDRRTRADLAVSAETRRLRIAAEQSRWLDATRAEWLARGMEPPTLGGIPVSVELMRRMGLLVGFKE
jgi:hypothetical protein